MIFVSNICGLIIFRLHLCLFPSLPLLPLAANLWSVQKIYQACIKKWEQRSWDQHWGLINNVTQCCWPIGHPWKAQCQGETVLMIAVYKAEDFQDHPVRSRWCNSVVGKLVIWECLLFWDIYERWSVYMY